MDFIPEANFKDGLMLCVAYKLTTQIEKSPEVSERFSTSDVRNKQWMLQN